MTERECVWLGDPSNDTSAPSLVQVNVVGGEAVDVQVT